MQPFKRLKQASLVLLLAAGVWLVACDDAAHFDPALAGADPQLQRGERIFRQQCASCHAIEPDVAIVGPSLAGIGTTAGQRIEGMSAPEYLEQAILDPNAYVVAGYESLMPTNFERRLNDRELEALIAYLLVLDED